MAENQRVKKRGRRWVVVAVATSTVALLACALVLRDQPPYEFLHGADRRLTSIIPSNTSSVEYAWIEYVSDRSVTDIAEEAASEFDPKGWTNSDDCFYSPEGISKYVDVVSGEEHNPQDARLRGKTLIHVHRPPTTTDRFQAWLDQRLGRLP